MQSSKFLVVALVLGLVACGGGGGSGAPPSGGTPPPAGGNPPEPPPESPPETPTGAQAAILFPWKNSGTTASSLVVRGTASSDDGIAQVLVNGMPAVLVPRTAEGPAEFTVTNSDTVTDVDWSIEVPLSPGANKLLATVVDGSGEETHEADSAEVYYHEVPVYFSLDATRSRVVGIGYTLTPTGKTPRLIEHDYLTAQQKARPWVSAKSQPTLSRSAEPESCVST